MALYLPDLDSRVRELMLEEFEGDLVAHRAYYSPRLSAKGLVDWAPLFREAIRAGTPATLAEALDSEGRLIGSELRRTPKGRHSLALLPARAAGFLAEDQFNRYYIRAVCRRAIEQGRPTVEVYRARVPARPRPRSEELVGQHLRAAAVLDDLRNHPGNAVALGVPGGPHSGLSVRLSA